MRKQAHKFILTVCLFSIFIISNPIFAENINENTTQNEQNSMELVQNEVNVKDLDIDPINTNAIKKSVIPDPKSEGKKVLGLFLKTICLSGLCALFLYVILLFVKKFNNSAFVTKEPEEFEALDLTTPDNKQDALKSFLNRTK